MNTQVTRGYPPQYKQARWRAWEGSAPYWPEYILRDDFHWKSHQQVVDAMWRHLTPSGPGPYSLCDLGCGSGLLLETARKEIGLRWKRLVGVDFSRHMLNMASEKDVCKYPRLRYWELDLESEINANNVPHLRDFDVTTAVFLLDELEKLEPCFATVVSMLRPEGYFVSGTLDYDREIERYDEPIKAAGQGEGPLVLTRTPDGDDFPGPYSRVLRQVPEIVDIAAKQGLCLIESRAISPTELRSRLTGPALRLMVWQRAKTTQ